jgi:hypothetical protein
MQSDLYCHSDKKPRATRGGPADAGLGTASESLLGRHQSVTVDGSEIDRPARPTAWAEDVEPGRFGDQRGADGG